ncbi:MAG: hypothetical protein LBC92_00750 [Rickettsiales bacterium]|jgi:hypothetical protein|nr:hypothetical protein [Rickettsiales bacterium]
MINEMSELERKLIEILDNIVVEDMPEIWKNSKFLKQRMIQIDKRGSVGERFFAEVLLKLYPRRIEYKDGDQGDWDLKINKIKFEIKTSSLDKNSKFQNESLKRNGDYDGILFFGIAPNDLYVKIVKKEDIDFNKLELRSDTGITKLHNRGKDNTENKATGAGYKCDFKIFEMKKVSTMQDIKYEFEKHFKF